ncbi:sensor histidine kinase [Alkaliphilus transvaalensis]|uniref:sensor histidine kinase n=1 Tax=Alkaliphilus transvaalensis TaxID=114628 RepID=UPI0004793D54|nr:HAMP domain-containing sensor histidine kinase [Alkaliphilus transvaalensis]
MSIRDRLRASYAAMLIIPIIISVLAAGFISRYFITEIEEAYNIQLNQSPILEFMDKNSLLIDEISRLREMNPEAFRNIGYLKKIDAELSEMNTGIIIRKDHEVVYLSEMLKSLDLIDKLPPFEMLEERDGRIFVQGQPFLVRQQDFYFEDSSEGSLFLIINMSLIVANLKRYMLTLFIVIIGVIIITNGTLTLLVSRSILKPLKVLEDAANQIKEGNLDFHIKGSSKDEIGQLSIAFEEMRLKLKESIGLQLEYERNRNELMSNISHDLKTPVTAIKGYVEGIMDGVADSPEKQERYIKTIYTKANDMDRLIDELLLYSKLDIKRLPFHFENVNIGQFLLDLTEELQFDLEYRGVKIAFKGQQGEHLRVLADREKIKRVIGNIVENAVKYMNKENGVIDVYLEKKATGNIMVEIRDNGQGIPEEYLPFIFDRFYRVDPSRNINTGGSGLGLAIAKRIIQEHGGEIWAKSEVDRGTSIIFTLKEWKEIDGGEISEENTNH